MSIWLRMIIVLVIVFVIGGIVFGLYLERAGFSAAEQPPRIEVAIARRLRGIAIPAGAKSLKNAESITPETFPEVSAHWMEHCATCHATDGDGDTVIGKNTYPKAPDLKDSGTQQLSDGEIFYIINNGVRFTAMPAWKNEDSEKELWQLVAFIRMLPKLEPAVFKQMEEKAAEERAHSEESGEEHEHGEHGEHEEHNEHHEHHH